MFSPRYSIRITHALREGHLPSILFGHPWYNPPLEQNFIGSFLVFHHIRAQALCETPQTHALREGHLLERIVRTSTVKSKIQL